MYSVSQNVNSVCACLLIFLQADWLMTINQAVANVISKTTTYRYMEWLCLFLFHKCASNCYIPVVPVGSPPSYM